jgi:flavin reductase (DIM6/NTAB) family NADH-FMN oxidoreductase RutF
MQLRQVFSTFPTGVTAIAASIDGAPVGISVNSFTTVSLEPPLVLVCISRASKTWPLLSRAPMLGISVLSAEQEKAGRQLSGSNEGRFEGLAWHATEDGAVLLEGASAWLECAVETQLEAGDHDIVVLSVHDLQGNPTVPPLIFHASRFHRLQ